MQWLLCRWEGHSVAWTASRLRAVPDPASLKGSCGEPGPGAAPCALQGWRLVWASLCSSVNEELPWGMRQARPAPRPARHTVDPTPVPETASQTVKGCAHEKL